jgi:hypothetical protein
MQAVVLDCPKMIAAGDQNGIDAALKQLRADDTADAPRTINNYTHA